MTAGASEAAFRTLGDASELRENDVNPYYIGPLKHRVAVARVDGKLFAFDDMYEGYPLSSALLIGTTIMSQFDGSQFDVKTGAVLRGPASAPLKTYDVREQYGKIEVRI